MIPQIETMTKMQISPQNMVLKPSCAFSASMLQRYLMRPQKKTTIASVIKRPRIPFKNVLKKTSVSVSVAAPARAGAKTARRDAPDTANR